MEEEEEVQVAGYRITSTLGKGTFGRVRIATHVATGEKVAAKILEKELIRDPSDVERISREIKILKKVYHPFIITLYEIVETENRLYLFMEYASEGDLFAKICAERKLKQNVAATYYLQLLNGLKYLHQQGISHRDLKPQNLLLENNQIKIADFGLGNFFEPNTLLKTACGSPCYAAPQMISKLSYDPAKVDAWSSGVVLYAMVMGYLPFEDTNVHNLYIKIKKGEFKIPDWLSEELKDLLRKVLNVNPVERLSIDELINHPWSKLFNKTNNIVPTVKLEPQLVSLAAAEHKLDREKLTKALMTKKHNSLTTTYYLWMKKRCRGNMDNKSAIQKKQGEPETQKSTQLSPSAVQKEEKKRQNTTLTDTIQTKATESGKHDSVKKKVEQSPIKESETNKSDKLEFSDVKSFDLPNIQQQEPIIPITPTKKEDQKGKQQLPQIDKPPQQKQEIPKVKENKNVIVQEQIKVEFQMTNKKIDKQGGKERKQREQRNRLRKVSRMQTQNMKKTATRIYQRSGSRQTDVSIRLTAARKNRFLLKRIEKKPRLFNTHFFFEGHVQELRDLVKKIEPNNLNIQLQYYELCANLFYIVKGNMDTERLRAGLLERQLKQ